MGTVSPGDPGLHAPPLFEAVGPLVEDWANYLSKIAEDLEPRPEAQAARRLQREEGLFSQVRPVREASINVSQVLHTGKLNLVV